MHSAKPLISFISSPNNSLFNYLSRGSSTVDRKSIPHMADQGHILCVVVMSGGNADLLSFQNGRCIFLYIMNSYNLVLFIYNKFKIFLTFQISLNVFPFKS